VIMFSSGMYIFPFINFTLM